MKKINKKYPAKKYPGQVRIYGAEMMKKIERLTDEQISKFPEYVNKWLSVGLSTSEMDREETSRAIDAVYKAGGLSAPSIKIYLDSPYAGNVAANVLPNIFEIAQFENQVQDQVWDQVENQVENQVLDQVENQVRNRVWGQVRNQVLSQVRNQVRDQVWNQVSDQVGIFALPTGVGAQAAHWLSFYNYLLTELHLVCCEPLVPLMDLAECCGWYWAYKDIVILTSNPETLKFDENDRLHCEDGPAVQYRDGFSVYSWHGTRIPREWIEDKGALTPEIALTWENIEQRRCAAEILGWHNVLDSLNTDTIDENSNPQIGTLLEVDLPDIGKSRFLKVQCGTGRTFALPVPPEVDTALAANAWTYGLEPEEFQIEVRT